MAKMIVAWDTPAKVSFKKLVKHIAEDSIQNAKLVRFEILSIIEGIFENRRSFHLIASKLIMTVRLGPFKKHSLRIAYFISTDQVRILRVRHVKQEPKEY